MILKVITLPLKIIFRTLGGAGGGLKMLLSTFFRMFTFVFKNIPGLTVGIIAGMLLAKKQPKTW